MFVNQLIPNLSFVKVQKTKLKVINFTRFVKVNLVEKQSVVSKGYLKTKVIHSLDELSEVKWTAKIFVQLTETLSEPLKFFYNFKMSMLY